VATFLLYGLRGQETMKWQETLLSERKTANEIERDKILADADGWHRLRIVIVEDEGNK
jgi:hypothetical protein